MFTVTISRDCNCKLWLIVMITKLILHVYCYNQQRLQLQVMANCDDYKTHFACLLLQTAEIAIARCSQAVIISLQLENRGKIYTMLKDIFLCFLKLFYELKNSLFPLESKIKYLRVRRTKIYPIANLLNIEPPKMHSRSCFLNCI